MTKVKRPNSAPCKMDGVWTKRMFLLYSYHAKWMVCGQETCSCSIPILLLNIMVSNNVATIVGFLHFKNMSILILNFKINKSNNSQFWSKELMLLVIDLQVQFWA
jgi:hypothetical protein